MKNKNHLSQAWLIFGQARLAQKQNSLFGKKSSFLLSKNLKSFKRGLFKSFSQRQPRKQPLWPF